MKYLLVKVDTNDADYVEKLTPITEDQIDELRPLFEAIKAFTPYTTPANGYERTHRHNFPYGGEVCRTDLGEKTPAELYPNHEDALELFECEYLPTGEQGDCHTVESIRILTVTEDEKAL